MGGKEEVRTVLLACAGGLPLRLVYAYDPSESRFHTVMPVLPGEGNPQVMQHRGPDTAADREYFFWRVLVELDYPSVVAQRMARTARHLARDEELTAPRTRAPKPARGPFVPPGARTLPPGSFRGLVAGALVGGWLAQGYGAVIGAFVGASTLPDLLRCGWQAVYARQGRGVVLLPDAVAGLLLAAGTVAGALLGFLTAHQGADQARAVFLGMSLAALSLSLVATRFSGVPLRYRAITWLGPLVVGGQAWVIHSLWSSPVGLAFGMVLGTLVAGALAGRIVGGQR